MTKKETILQAATILFSKNGYNETSMSELSKMTGAAESTIFYHFKSKENLFLAILERVKEDIIKEFEGYMETKQFETGIDMVETAVSFYLYLAGRMENQFLMLHRHFPYKLAEENTVCRGHLEAIYDCLVDIFEQAVLLGQKDGSIGQMPARKIALIIFSMVDGIARFKTYNLYDAGALYNELIGSCRRILQNKKS
jgi:AcrR family transcriptional regulator